MARTPSRLSRRLDVVDPGATRRLRALRATAACACVWPSLGVLGRVNGAAPEFASVLFGVVACFVAGLVVNDLLPRARLLTLGWSLAGAVAATTLGAALHDAPLLARALLLVLVFWSLAARRWGERTGSVALVATMTAYFASSLGAAPDVLPTFLLAAALGYAWLVAWQFVLLPYDPRAAVVRAGTSYFRRVAEVLDAVDLAAQDPSRSGAADRVLREAHTCRQVIDTQAQALQSPDGEARDLLERLQLTLTAAEQGAARLVDSLGPGAAPTDPALPAIRLLRDAIRAGRAAEVTAEIDRVLGPLDSGLARGTDQLSRATAEARRLLDDLADPRIRIAASLPASPPPATGRLPLATVLGLQAAAATGISMGAAALIGLERADWMSWTSFVVIAGSAGESVRRVVRRVVGTVGGGLAGLAAGPVLPDGTVVLVAVVVATVFAALYVAPVSYSLLAFWLTFGLVVVAVTGGTSGLALLVDRSTATVLGGLVAAVVVLTIFPVRIRGRYRPLLLDYLDAVRQTVDRVATAVLDPRTSLAVVESLRRADTAHDTLDRAMAAAAFESSPFPRAASSLGDQMTVVARVHEALARVVRTMPDAGAEPADAAGRAAEVVDLVEQELVLVRAAVVDPSTAPPPASPPRPVLPVEDHFARALLGLYDALAAARVEVQRSGRPVLSRAP